MHIAPCPPHHPPRLQFWDRFGAGLRPRCCRFTLVHPAMALQQGVHRNKGSTEVLKTFPFECLQGGPLTTIVSNGVMGPQEMAENKWVTGFIIRRNGLING